MKKIIDIHERLPFGKMLPLSIQHVFAMFGATVLVPYLTGLNPSIALLSSGVGTLLFILITGGKVPAYLGSSFAFIAPIIVASGRYGVEYALGGTLIIGLFYAAVSLLITAVGTKWLDRALPPVVIGSVIVVIGLGLAPVAVEMASLITVTEIMELPNTADAANALVGVSGINALEDGALEVSRQVYSPRSVLVAAFTLAVTIIASIFLKGFFAVIPILIGIIAGYIFSLTLGMVDFSAVAAAPFFALPTFTMPRFNMGILAIFLPVALVTIAEHLGDVLVTGTVVGRDFYKNPGLNRTLLGDGVATAFAGLVGGPPNTTYGENIGVMAITRVYSVYVIGLAAVVAISLSFIGKLGALLQTIPVPVMGGISMVLFGIIASSGIRTLVESGIDFGNKRNLIIASVILVLGIGGGRVAFGPIEISGMALATIVGILLNLLLPEAVVDRQEA